MLNQLYFKSCYGLETIAPETVFFVSERQTSWLNDRLSYRVATLIQNHHTADEIIAILQQDLLEEQQVDPESDDFFQVILDISIRVQAALTQMYQQGYLQGEPDTLPDEVSIICHHLNVLPHEADRRLKSTSVEVKAVGTVSAHDLVATLASLQIQVAEPGDLTLVLTDDYLHPDLAAINQAALDSGRPWLLVKPVGTIVWLGPLFHPGQTGCWDCLAQRLRHNRPIEAFIQRQQQRTTPVVSPLGSLASTRHTALNMAATEVFKWIVQGGQSPLQEALITYDTIALQTQSHPWVKRPQCPSCGEMRGLPRSPLPVALGHRPVTFTADGGYRCSTPQATLQTYQQHISPITGIVREIDKIPSHDLTQIYVAKHHFLSVFDDLAALRQNLGGRSAGKGKTDLQAKASGFCEAIERYSGVFQGDEIRQQGSYQSLGELAIHPNVCMNFSQQQYQTRDIWNAQCKGWFQKVPEPFDLERELDWTPIWSLTHQVFKYLPTAYCYYGYPTQNPPDCWADSNGCAAGNTLEEAILQGFMELVERDSVAIWWYNRLQKPQIDLDSVDDPYVQTLRQYYHSLDRQLWVLDLTSDLGIPTFAAISRRPDRPVEDIVLGYGTHFDPQIALSRALTELNQVLPNVLSVDAAKTHYPRSTDPHAREWWQTATLANQPYLAPDLSQASKCYSDYPCQASSDLLENVRRCQKIVESNGMELLVLDQTRPDVGLRVAKVIVPGLRHMWKRLAPGRLYDVPVKLGWLQASLPELELNPFPMWM